MPRTPDGVRCTPPMKGKGMVGWMDALSLCATWRGLRVATTLVRGHTRGLACVNREGTCIAINAGPGHAWHALLLPASCVRPMRPLLPTARCKKVATPCSTETFFPHYSNFTEFGNAWAGHVEATMMPPPHPTHIDTPNDTFSHQHRCRDVATHTHTHTHTTHTTHTLHCTAPRSRNAATPRHATPRHATPRHATPRHVAHKQYRSQSRS
jgi:hypothetical protein